MNIEKIREEFEAWYIKGWDLDEDQAGEALVRFPDDRTKYWPDVQPLWEAWQASRAAIEVELPPLSGMNSSFVEDGIQKTREHNRYNAAIKDCRKAIESIGLKVMV